MFRIVAALKDTQDRNTNLGKSSSHIVESIRRDSEVSQRIEPGGIEPTTDQKKLWFKLFDDRFDKSVVDIDVLVVSSWLAAVRSVVFVIVIEGNVDFGTLSFTFSAIVVVTLLTRGIVDSMVVAVNGDEKNFPIFLKDSVGTVSSMNIPV